MPLRFFLIVISSRILESIRNVFCLIDSCVSQQAADAGKPASPHPSLLVAANQAAVINAAKNASATPGGTLSKTPAATSVKGSASSAATAKGAVGSAGAPGTVAKGVTSVPVVSMSKGAGLGTLVSVPKGSGTSLVTTGSVAAGGGKTGTTLSGTRHPHFPSRASASTSHVERLCVWSAGMLKIHSGGSSSQQTVLTIPANQLKQLGVGSGSGGLQTILMPVGKGRLVVVVGRFELCFEWILLSRL